MADRKQFFGDIEADPDLKRMLEGSSPVTEEDLHEQRISFAFGNAPLTPRASPRTACDWHLSTYAYGDKQ